MLRHPAYLPLALLFAASAALSSEAKQPSGPLWEALGKLPKGSGATVMVFDYRDARANRANLLGTNAGRAIGSIYWNCVMHAGIPIEQLESVIVSEDREGLVTVLVPTRISAKVLGDHLRANDASTDVEESGGVTIFRANRNTDAYFDGIFMHSDMKDSFDAVLEARGGKPKLQELPEIRALAAIIPDCRTAWISYGNLMTEQRLPVNPRVAGGWIDTSDSKRPRIVTVALFATEAEAQRVQAEVREHLGKGREVSFEVSGPLLTMKEDQLGETKLRAQVEGDLSFIRLLLEQSQLESAELPSTSDGLAKLGAKTWGWAFGEVPKDPWVHPYSYRLGNDGQYDLRSLGPDGKLDNGDDLALGGEGELVNPGPLAGAGAPVEEPKAPNPKDLPLKPTVVDEPEKPRSDDPGSVFFGVGGSVAGLFANRNGDSKRRALGRFDGSKSSEAAVDSALRWLKKHQGVDGLWEATAYPHNCTDNPQVEASNELSDQSGNAVATCYALLCFTGAGYDHRMPSKYKATVKKAVEWLTQRSSDDCGSYELALTTCALAECFGMSNDPELKEPVSRRAKALSDRQAKEQQGQPLGTTAWSCIALRSAAAVGIEVGNWKDRGLAALRGTQALNDESSCRALLAIYLGLKRGDAMLDGLIKQVANDKLPASLPVDPSRMFFATQAMFNAGGDDWTRWNSQMRNLLVNAQRKSADCFDGSWDCKEPANAIRPHSIGRLVGTALCCLCLEAYYRELPMKIDR